MKTDTGHKITTASSAPTLPRGTSRSDNASVVSFESVTPAAGLGGSGLRDESRRFSGFSGLFHRDSAVNCHTLMM